MAKAISHSFLPLFILLISFALRVLWLDKIPLGLSHDEANNGIAALHVLDGARSIFFEINKGIEPLIIYFEALAFQALGIEPFALRWVNLIAGQLTVALTYPLARRLFNRPIALLAMSGVSLSFWAIFVSRLTLRAVLLPPLLLIVLYGLWRGLHHRRPQTTLLYLSLSGLAHALAMYTYLSSRFVWVMVGGYVGWLILRHLTGKFTLTRWHWLGLALHFIIWLIIVSPLAMYYWHHQTSFDERANQVTTIPYLLNGEFAPTLTHTARTLGMFTVQGDTTDRYNLDSRPVFGWLNGLFFYIGLLGLILYGWRAETINRTMFLLIWLFTMLLPDFITDDSPHFLRTIGVLPLVYLIWAMGVDAVTTFLSRLQHTQTTPLLYRWGLPIALLLLMMGQTINAYFFQWATAEEARYIYGADIAEIALLMQQPSAADLTVISSEYYRDLDPFRYQLHTHNEPPFALWFDGQQSIAFPPSALGLETRYLFADSAPPHPRWLSWLTLTETGQNYQQYHLTAGFQPEAITLQHPFSETINDDLVLLGYERTGPVKTAGKFELFLLWQALRALPPGTDYTFLVHLRDMEGRTWAESDGLGYSPSDWQPGVRGLQRLLMRLPVDLPPQTYELTLTLVDRTTGQPLLTTTGETSMRLEIVESQPK